jgi:hypothetical protein
MRPQIETFRAPQRFGNLLFSRAGRLFGTGVALISFACDRAGAIVRESNTKRREV